MRKFALLATTLLSNHAAIAGGCNAIPNYPAADGGFGVFDGQIYTPDGNAFVPHGINVAEYDQPSANTILAKFPGTNFVRLAIFDYPSAASLTAYVNDLTSHGIFVELEDHTSSDGSNTGGNQGVIYTGQQLATELAWYSSVAGAFKDNPYVGFGTDNEPSSTNASGASDPAGLSNWQLQTYQAIRNAGNNSMVWLETVGWNTVRSWNVGFNPAAYAGMTNVAWDMHPYPQIFPSGGSVSADAGALNSYVATVQRITSADGAIPVSFLEDGNSTMGTYVDNGWQNALQAVQQSGLGSVAWLWGNGNPGDGLLSDPAYASVVASYNATSGATGCPASPLPPINTSPAMMAANAAVASANTLSVADVASMAATGSGTSAASVTAVSQLAGLSPSGPAAGGTLPIDAVTAAALAIPLATPVAVPVRTVSSPGGTMPTPQAQSASIAVNATGDYQTVVGGAGNASGTISGTGTTVNASGGIATLNVTGPGNTITTGPYDDTITVKTAGNTINTGGGNDTIILAYPGQASSTVINADAPALPPLASAGNVFVAPAAGTGVLTIRGVLAANDRLDLTKVLAGTAGFNGSNLWNFISATTSPQGCVIAVGGKTVILLPNGSPNGDIGGFIVARAG